MRTIAIGASKGHRYTKNKRLVKDTKGVNGAQRRLAHDTIREICGYTPYEKRTLELLRNGYDKRALRLCKRKLGTMARAKHKREELNQMMQKARLEHMHEHEHHNLHHDDKKKAKKAAKKTAKKAEKKEEKKEN